MNRLEKIRKHIDKNGIGVEIGPIHTPKAPKREGYHVHIIDHLSREELVLKYKNQKNVDTTKIEEVDFVWKGESYAELTGRTGYYDWVIASHVVEHTPDLIGFLNNCDEILKESGVISLVVPDKRYCFDHFRPASGLGAVIDAHLQQRSVPSFGLVAEHFLNAVTRQHPVTKKKCNSWKPEMGGEFQFVHPMQRVHRAMADARNGMYVDCHVWCFTPHSFRLMIHDLHALGLIFVQEVDFQMSTGAGFFMTLGRKGTGSPLSRMELLEKSKRESREMTSTSIETIWRRSLFRLKETTRHRLSRKTR